MVTPAGLEPATARLEISCSIQLSYGADGIVHTEVRDRSWLVDAVVAKIVGVVLGFNVPDTRLVNAIFKSLFLGILNSRFRFIESQTNLAERVLRSDPPH
jgi:hypothetical protein